MNTLENANKELKAAVKTERQTDNKDKKADKKDAVTGEKENNIVVGTEKTKIMDDENQTKII